MTAKKVRCTVSAGPKKRDRVTTSVGGTHMISAYSFGSQNDNGDGDGGGGDPVCDDGEIAVATLNVSRHIERSGDYGGARRDTHAAVIVSPGVENVASRLVGDRDKR